MKHLHSNPYPPKGLEHKMSPGVWRSEFDAVEDRLNRAVGHDHRKPRNKKHYRKARH